MGTELLPVRPSTPSDCKLILSKLHFLAVSGISCLFGFTTLSICVYAQIFAFAADVCSLIMMSVSVGGVIYLVSSGDNRSFCALTNDRYFLLRALLLGQSIHGKLFPLLVLLDLLSSYRALSLAHLFSSLS